MILVSISGCPCPIHWSQMLSREWRCSWSSADRRCSNYICMNNNVIAYSGAPYIRCLTVIYLISILFRMIFKAGCVRKHNIFATNTSLNFTCSKTEAAGRTLSFWVKTHAGICLSGLKVMINKKRIILNNTAYISARQMCSLRLTITVVRIRTIARWSSLCEQRLGKSARKLCHK